jgi:hypothetical protein
LADFSQTHLVTLVLCLSEVAAAEGEVSGRAEGQGEEGGRQGRPGAYPTKSYKYGFTNIFNCKYL